MNVPEQLPGGVDVGRPTIVSANPLNAAGAAPPVRAFTFDHCAPHHVRP